MVENYCCSFVAAEVPRERDIVASEGRCEDAEGWANSSNHATRHLVISKTLLCRRLSLMAAASSHSRLFPARNYLSKRESRIISFSRSYLTAPNAKQWQSISFNRQLQRARLRQRKHFLATKWGEDRAHRKPINAGLCERDVMPRDFYFPRSKKIQLCILFPTSLNVLLVEGLWGGIAVFILVDHKIRYTFFTEFS